MASICSLFPNRISELFVLTLFHIYLFFFGCRRVICLSDRTSCRNSINESVESYEIKVDLLIKADDNLKLVAPGKPLKGEIGAEELCNQTKLGLNKVIKRKEKVEEKYMGRHWQKSTLHYRNERRYINCFTVGRYLSSLHYFWFLVTR